MYRHRFNWASVHGLISCHYTPCVQRSHRPQPQSSQRVCFCIISFFFHSFLSHLSFFRVPHRVESLSSYTQLSTANTHILYSNYTFAHLTRSPLHLCICREYGASICFAEFGSKEKKNIKRKFKHKIRLPTNTQVRHRVLAAGYGRCCRGECTFFVV